MRRCKLYNEQSFNHLIYLFKIKAKEIEFIKILRYEESVYFANVENFIYKIIKCSGVNPNEIISKINKKKSYFEKKLNSLQKVI